MSSIIADTELAASSLSPIYFLPSEILLMIMALLGVDQVLTLRQTCKRMFQVAQDRSLWIALLEEQQQTLPLPPLSAPRPLDLPTLAIQSIVTSANHVAYFWPRSRQPYPVKFQPKSGETLLGLQIFLDRWLLSVYADGLIYLWDLDPPNPRGNISSTDDFGAEGKKITPVRCASLDLWSKGWISYTAALDPSGNKVFLAVARAEPPITIRIYRIELGHSRSFFSPNTFELVHSIFTPIAQTLRVIEPALQLVAFSSTNFVELARWPSEENNHAQMSVSIQTGDLEELWNGIIGVRLMGPYVLILKSRSIELHPLAPLAIIPSLASYLGLPPHSEALYRRLLKLTYHLRETTFRDIHCSDVFSMPTEDPEKKQSFRVSFLGYDVLQGVFQYAVTVVLYGDGLVSFDVNCVGVYAMANNINMSAISPLYGMPAGGSAFGGLDTPAPPTPPLTHVDTTQIGILAQVGERLGANAISRGFVSAMALGPQGKRAVWVERKRGSTIREVLVWGKRPEREAEGIAMDGNVVYAVGSYDLREDITHCAFGEMNGRIVLGNRAGDIFVLGLGVS